MRHLSSLRMVQKLIVYFFEVILYMHLAVQEEEVLHIISSVNSHCTTTSCLTLSQFAKTTELRPNSDSIQLLFLPGDHNLNADLDISNIKGLFLTSSSSLQPKITCQQNKSFHFHKIGTISIKGLKFLGCGKNEIAACHKLEVRNSLFLGNNTSGSALELIDTNARIVNCFFAFNTCGNFRGPIQILKFGNHGLNTFL